MTHCVTALPVDAAGGGAGGHSGGSGGGGSHEPEPKSGPEPGCMAAKANICAAQKRFAQRKSAT